MTTHRRRASVFAIPRPVFLLAVWGAAAPAATGLAAPVAATQPASTSASTPANANAATATGAAPARNSGAAAAPLPPARPVDAILADMVAAVGGAAALGRHKSLHTKMEMTFKGLGIKGTAEHWAVPGDKALTVTNIPNLASTREGSDGTQLWSEDPINGLRLLDGVEAEQARLELAWNPELRMKELFPKMEARNEIGEGGARLECLILTPKLSPPTTYCMDAKTHLLVTQQGVRSGPQGDMPFAARLSDWRSVGDIKIAHASDTQVGPLSFTARVTDIELDTPLDPGMFVVPTPPKPGGPGPGGKSKARETHKARSPAAKK